MVKTGKSVIAWKIHKSVPFQLVCILLFVSIAYEIIDFWMGVPGLQLKHLGQMVFKLASKKIIGKFVCRMVKDFLNNSHMLKVINKTFITLIPKSKN